MVFAFVFILDLSSLIKKKIPEKTYRNFYPKTLIIVPCKGNDLTLYENLASLKTQDFKGYEVIAVIDDEKDNAIASIKKAGIKYIITNKKENGSGKVKAIATALKRFDSFEVYAIADSDVLFDKKWLEALIKPLSDKNVGISSMYPFFKPMKMIFWSEMKMVWGFVGDSLMENEKRRFGWGGSLAFRRELIDKNSMKFFTNSIYSVSDDISLTKIAKSKGLTLAYVKEPKPIVNCDETFSGFFEWANRQTALTLLGYKKNLYEGLIYYTSEIVLLISGITLSLFLSPIFLLFFLHSVKSIILSYRRSSVKDPKVAIIVLIAPFFYEINLIIASRMKTIKWRGIEYRLLNQSRIKA